MAKVELRNGKYREAIEVFLRGDQILDTLVGQPVSKSGKNALALPRIECNIKSKDLELGEK
jgi:hypothetical protein